MAIIIFVMKRYTEAYKKEPKLPTGCLQMYGIVTHPGSIAPINCMDFLCDTSWYVSAFRYYTSDQNVGTALVPIFVQYIGLHRFNYCETNTGGKY